MLRSSSLLSLSFYHSPKIQFLMSLANLKCKICRSSVALPWHCHPVIMSGHQTLATISAAVSPWSFPSLFAFVFGPLSGQGIQSQCTRFIFKDSGPPVDCHPYSPCTPKFYRVYFSSPLVNLLPVILLCPTTQTVLVSLILHIRSVLSLHKAIEHLVPSV